MRAQLIGAVFPRWVVHDVPSILARRLLSLRPTQSDVAGLPLTVPAAQSEARRGPQARTTGKSEATTMRASLLLHIHHHLLLHAALFVGKCTFARPCSTGTDAIAHAICANLDRVARSTPVHVPTPRLTTTACVLIYFLPRIHLVAVPAPIIQDRRQELDPAAWACSLASLPNTVTTPQPVLFVGYACRSTMASEHSRQLPAVLSTTSCGVSPNDDARV
jgi:hypothetical protein